MATSNDLFGCRHPSFLLLALTVENQLQQGHNLGKVV